MKNKYTLFILILSTAIIFVIWKTVLDASNATTDYLILSIIGIITSYGVYKGVVTTIYSLAKKIEFINKYFLGNEYLNGRWIGFYKGVSGDVRFIVESYEQNLEDITIRGHAYDKEMNLHSTWKSTSVQIDGKQGKIVYTYSVTGLNENTNGTGFAEFDFERVTPGKYPTIIQGYSSDLHIGKRVRSYEMKVIDKSQIKLSEINLVAEAKILYENYGR